MTKNEALDILQKASNCIRIDIIGDHGCDSVCSEECPYWCETADIFNAIQFAIEYMEKT